MNLYLLTQETVYDYDTFDSCIVCAASNEEARKIHPSEYVKEEWWTKNEFRPDWPTKLEDIKVTLLGTAIDTLSSGVVLASFNAG